MRALYCISILIMLGALPTTSVAADRAEKVRALMQAQGLAATFEQQIAQGREVCRKQADQVVTQILAGSRLPPEYEAKMRAAVLDFVDAVQPDSADDIVTSWAKLYGSKFTDEELDQLLAFYTSPLAQKEVVVGRDAMAQLTTLLMESYAPRMKAATDVLIARMQAISEECNCTR